MNEHLRKFEKESGLEIYGLGAKRDRWEAALEKYAELIVRQCAEVGLDSVEDGDDLDAIMKRVHNNILKHFGVKE